MSTYNDSAIKTYSNKKYYNISITHMSSKNTITFPAFLTEYNDSFKNDYNIMSEPGFVAPVYTHKHTTRTINFSIDLVSDKIGQAKSNFNKLKQLGLFMYPKRMEGVPTSYVAQSFGVSITDGTTLSLIKIKFANLIGTGIKGDGPGLMGYVNGISINPVIEHGFFEARGAIYPKTYNLTINLEVVHAEPPNLQAGGSGGSTTSGTQSTSSPSTQTSSTSTTQITPSPSAQTPTTQTSTASGTQTSTPPATQAPRTPATQAPPATAPAQPRGGQSATSTGGQSSSSPGGQSGSVSEAELLRILGANSVVPN